MPIFISHTTKDDIFAKKVYCRLSNIHGIKCYIDDIDEELANRRGKSDLTPVLVNRLRRCDTLLAIVTENTKNSWWVPFEIGTAREMPRVITSYTSLVDESSCRNSLPEFLLEWPRLRSQADIDIFARRYKLRQASLMEDVRSFSSADSVHERVRGFEINIMRALNQRS